MSKRKARGWSRERVGVVTLVVLGVLLFLGFTKDIPFTRPFEVDAVFTSATSIRPGSPVRIAGVNVGKVQEVLPEEDGQGAVLRLMINDRGLPLHEDAQAKIRPRIFLEGNFFVDLQQGSPGAPVLEDGGVIKVTQTSTPVQLDEVLTALQDDPREDLKTVLDELAVGLGGRPEGGGQTAAEALNDAYEDIAPAERDTAVVMEALLGTEPDRDQRRLLRGLAAATGGLGRNERQLQDLVTNLDRTMGALAAESGALRASIRELGPTLQQANAAFDELNEAFPSARAFAVEILPGVRETPATIAAGFPWIAETRRLLRPAELGGLARDLQPAARDLAGFVDASLAFFPQADLLARCTTDVLLPTGDVPIRDEFATGQPNYREFAYSLVGFAGEGSSHDANAPFVAFQPGGGQTTYRLGPSESSVQFTNGFANSATRPKKPSRKPPFNTSVPCFESKRPDLNGPWAAKGSFGTVVATQPSQPALRTSLEEATP